VVICIPIFYDNSHEYSRYGRWFEHLQKASYGMATASQYRFSTALYMTTECFKSGIFSLYKNSLATLAVVEPVDGRVAQPL
jgi:hypothetical protein